MLIYDLVFMQFYLFSKLFKNVPGSIFRGDPALTGIMLLSTFELLNLATIWLYFDFRSITGNNLLDVILGFALFFVPNCFYFFYKSRYKNIPEKHKNNASELAGTVMMCTIAYTILTIIFFYLAHSR